MPDDNSVKGQDGVCTETILTQLGSYQQSSPSVWKPRKPYAFVCLLSLYDREFDSNRTTIQNLPLWCVGTIWMKQSVKMSLFAWMAGINFLGVPWPRWLLCGIHQHGDATLLDRTNWATSIEITTQEVCTTLCAANTLGVWNGWVWRWRDQSSA